MEDTIAVAGGARAAREKRATAAAKRIIANRCRFIAAFNTAFALVCLCQDLFSTYSIAYLSSDLSISFSVLLPIIFNNQAINRWQNRRKWFISFFNVPTLYFNILILLHNGM
ncbi:hypothetical protein [Pontibacter brevis]